jgi:hypothetical protein
MGIDDQRDGSIGGASNLIDVVVIQTEDAVYEMVRIVLW